jgi:CheY-specific phosphatase CheX
MMQNEERKILKEVCFGVFEQLAFMFGDELEDDEIEAEGNRFLRASMGFKGQKKQGTVEIIVPLAISKLLATNILGLEEEQIIDEDSAIDALKELLNTITGRLMTTLFGEDVVVDLTIPAIVELDHAAWDDLVQNSQYLAITIEETPVLVSIQS